MLNELDFEMKILEEFINWTFRFAVKTSVKEELFDVFSIYFRIKKEAGHSSCPRMTVCFVLKR